MFDTDQLYRNLVGAWLVMNGRARGLKEFDLSIDGFWRSFGAIVFIIPLVAVTLWSDRAVQVELGEPTTQIGLGAIALRLLALIAEWVGFPLAMAALARPLGVAANFVPFVVARNWGAVLIAALFLPVHILHATQVLSLPVVQFLSLVLIVLAIRFSYLIARTALAAPIAIAIPVIVLEFVLGMVITVGFDRLAS